jgi:hypothetical protein
MKRAKPAAAILSVAVACLVVATTLRGEVLSRDARRLVSRADILLDKPAPKSEEGLPIGNGRMGTLLWTEGSKLRMQINRVDVFGNNSATTSFPERHSDYCGGCGLVDIDFALTGSDSSGSTAPVFPEEHTKQHLACYDGRVTIEGVQIKVEALAWSEQDVIALRVLDGRRKEHAGSIAVNLTMLRAPLARRYDHTAVSVLDARGQRLMLTQKFTEGEYYCGSAVSVAVLGREADVERSSDQTISLILKPGPETFTILIASRASFAPQRDLADEVMRQIDGAAAGGFSAIYESNKEWWEAFWQKSFVHLHSEDGVADELEAGYTYYLYLMGSTSRGKYPTKFNGMLWNTGGDRRTWGGQFWGANQSCLYNNALSAANHMELMRPMFDMYWGMYDSCALAARQQWGGQGIYIPETVCFDGLAPLPDDVAAEMRGLYLLRKPWSSMSQGFRDYAAKRQPHSSRWNWMVGGRMVDGRWAPGERGSGPYGPVTHIFSRGAKIAYQYWLQYEYTHDKAWLSDRAYPMLKGVAEFYRNYPNLKKEADGRYHIHDVNSNEPLWGGQDTDEEIASMMGILPAAIRASGILDVDADLRDEWQELLDHLAPLPRSDMPAAGARPREIGEAPTWVESLNPVVKGNAAAGSDGNTIPVWFFDLCTLETTGPLRETGEATANRFLPTQSDRQRRVGVLSKVPLLAATMARADAVEVLVPSQMRGGGRATVMANRMDLREGPQTQNVERMGNAADALTTALCQSIPAGPAQDNVIHVFPAWPAAWDAEFMLFCRGGFLVSSSIRKGHVEFIEIASQLGSHCRIRNPWSDQAVLYRDGTETERFTGQLLEVDSAKGETFVLVQTGTTPEQFRR